MTQPGSEGRFGRRGLLGAVGASGGAALAAAGLASCTRDTRDEPDPAQPRGRTWSPHGDHQAGITTPVPAATSVVAFDLRAGSTAEDLRRLLRLWSADIEALMAGRPLLADPMPDMAQSGVSLSVTVGLGLGVFELQGLRDKRPAALADLPAFRHDALLPQWSGGDLVVVIGADDATTVGYAQRVLTRDAATFATPRWVQDGHWRGTDASGRPITGRNLFGQVDGTGNVVAKAHEAIWSPHAPEWFAGGTTLVVRRIEMNLTTWDQLVRERQEKVIGRTLATGAPLGGDRELQDLDLDAKDATGRPLIALDAHARLSHPSQNGGRTMLRRAVNYTHVENGASGARSSAGLLFMSFQSSIPEVFTPIQTNLDERDALNEWTTAIGSAVFAIPGGFGPGRMIAEKLFV